MNSRELATVLAALRTYQKMLGMNGDMPDNDVKDVATDGGTIEPMNVDEIDELCERLNCDVDPQHDALVQQHDALVQLLLAYAKNDSGYGSIEWDDVDRAVEMAKDALPGEYERIVADLAEEA